MPYSYFRTDVTGDNDLALLPPELRDSPDMANVAASAETDVLERYTRFTAHPSGCAVVVDEGTSMQRYVYLRGYACDPMDAAEPFAAAFRREIANVIRWRLARANKKPNVTSESATSTRTTRVYRTDAEQSFPPDFGRVLALYALGRVAVAI